MPVIRQPQGGRVPAICQPHTRVLHQSHVGCMLAICQSYTNRTSAILRCDHNSPPHPLGKRQTAQPTQLSSVTARNNEPRAQLRLILGEKTSVSTRTLGYCAQLRSFPDHIRTVRGYRELNQPQRATVQSRTPRDQSSLAQFAMWIRPVTHPLLCLVGPEWSGPGRRFRYDFPALLLMIRGVLSPGAGAFADR